MKIMFLGSLLTTKWLAVTPKYRVDLIMPVLTASPQAASATLTKGPAAQAHRG